MDELIESSEYQKSRDALREASWQNRRHSAEGIVDYLVESAEKLQKEEEEKRKTAEAEVSGKKKGKKEEGSK